MTPLMFENKRIYNIIQIVSYIIVKKSLVNIREFIDTYYKESGARL